MIHGLDDLAAEAWEKFQNQPVGDAPAKGAGAVKVRATEWREETMRSCDFPVSGVSRDESRRFAATLPPRGLLAKSAPEEPNRRRGPFGSAVFLSPVSRGNARIQPCR
jgi:hypothetical protein